MADSKVSYTAVWGEYIGNIGFVQVPNCFLRCRQNLGLTQSQAIVLIHLLSYSYGKDYAYPSQKTLSLESGMAYPTIRANIRALERKGFLHRERRGNTSNIYAFDQLIDRLSDHNCTIGDRIQAEDSSFSNRSPPSFLIT